VGASRATSSVRMQSLCASNPSDCHANWLKHAVAAKLHFTEECETGANMHLEKNTLKGMRYLAVLAVCCYVVGLSQEYSSQPPLPDPATATPHAIAPQPASDIALPSETLRALTTAQIASRCERSIAIVSGRFSTGTGFLVRPGLLATNAHVVSDERIENILIAFPSVETGAVKTEILFEDPRRDLALLAVPTDLPRLEVESAYRFRRGQDVTVIGNPSVNSKLILKNAVSRGVMSTEAVVGARVSTS
jgi:hypothetical protein